MAHSQPETDAEEQPDGLPSLPDQTEVFQMPRRFGHVPVEEAPLGWDNERRFEKVYPRIDLPFQEIERITFGHPDLDPNRLFYGDNLHIMRALPSESIDLIYIDPPFFSGRNYNLLFGDKSELRSFTDIWEGGLNGYLVWLNARLYEMKRLLKDGGSLFVHLDWHAAHYVKQQLDRIFGYENFRNEIIWYYRRWTAQSKSFQRYHDTILWYSRSSEWVYNQQWETPANVTKGRKESYERDEDGRMYRWQSLRGKRYKIYRDEQGVNMGDVWEVPFIHPSSKERIGYPTQKPIELLQRIVDACSNPGDVVADFFVGGGSFLDTAQGTRVERKDGQTRKIIYDPTKARRWIGSDISRVATSITIDRLSRVIESGGTKQIQGSLETLPDITVSNWGIYDTDGLTHLQAAAFREFVVKAFGGRLASGTPGIDGYKGREPLLVGSPMQDEPVTAEQVAEFAKACLRRSDSDEARGTVLAWTFSREASEFADRLLAQRKTRVRFVRLKLLNIESVEFKAHVVEKSEDYESFLSFVLPPVARFSAEPVDGKRWRFDATESQSLNAGGNIINVQWDFDFRDFFTSTTGFTFSRSKKGLDLTAEYEFPTRKKWRVACRMQDDVGGQATVIGEVDVD